MSIIASIHYLNLGDALERTGQDAPEAAFRATIAVITGTEGEIDIGASVADILDFDVELAKARALVKAAESGRSAE